MTHVLSIGIAAVLVGALAACTPGQLPVDIGAGIQVALGPVDGQPATPAPCGDDLGVPDRPVLNHPVAGLDRGRRSAGSPPVRPPAAAFPPDQSSSHRSQPAGV